LANIDNIVKLLLLLSNTIENAYMIKVPAAKRPAEIVTKVTIGYAEVGMGALIGVPAVQSS
jgi:hypothetical protein